jgi:hypothetical protein
VLEPRSVPDADRLSDARRVEVEGEVGVAAGGASLARTSVALSRVDGVRRFALAVSVAPAVVALGCGSSDVSSMSPAAVARASPGTPTDAAVAPCATGVVAPGVVRAGRDAVLGPFVLIGADETIGEPPAGRTLGYKVPVTLPAGVTATLSVAPPSYGHVGLVFTQAAKARVLDRGLRGADRAVTFQSCGRTRETARTGWPGVLVLDRPRCATLAVTTDGVSVRHQVALGRRCATQ